MKLCGGTLLTLLCAVKRAPGNRVTFLGMKGACSEAMMLAGLLKMICPEYREDVSAAFKTTASRYKNCRCDSGMNLPMDKSEFTAHFQRRVLEQMPDVLGEMELYCRTFLRVEEADRMEWLTKGILSLIASDPLARDKLVYCPDGKILRAGDVLEMKTICLPVLLTGCLDYIVRHVPYNTEGQETIERWIRAKDGVHQAGVLSGTIGQSIRHPVCVEMKIPEAAPAGPAKEACPDEPGMREKNGPSADEPGPKAMTGSVGPQERSWDALPGAERFRTAAPKAAGEAGTVQTFNGVNIFSGACVGQVQYVQMPAAGGGSLMELLSLDTGLYHLFVTEGSLFQGNTFSVAKTVSLNRHIRQEIREHFLDLGPAEQAELIRLPAVFASVNRGDRETEAVHMAMLGRITAIHVQSSVISFEWKAFCPFPQQLLNRNESLFSIWHAPAANELEEEHWTIKPVSLIRSLQTAGFDPYRSMSAVQPWN